jgi:hypothetical protein
MTLGFSVRYLDATYSLESFELVLSSVFAYPSRVVWLSYSVVRWTTVEPL